MTEKIFVFGIIAGLLFLCLVVVIFHEEEIKK